MASFRARRASAPEWTDLYQDITDRIIAQLEQGRVPGVQPWDSAAATLDLPVNASTRARYSGINILILWSAMIERGFTTNRFLTFRQALELGGNVRKGERGMTVVYAHRYTPQQERERAREEDRTPGTIPFLKRYTVFSTDQCEGLPEDLSAQIAPVDRSLILPEADALIRATGADIRIVGGEAFYVPSRDYIQITRPEAFPDPINWHRTAFHELGHWTGHPSRLSRDQSGRFGSPEYGREELCAEMTSAFVCAALGIEPSVRHADYLGSWLAILREDNRAIVRAASAASKAADFLLAFGRTEEEPIDLAQAA